VRLIDDPDFIRPVRYNAKELERVFHDSVRMGNPGRNEKDVSGLHFMDLIPEVYPASTGQNVLLMLDTVGMQRHPASRLHPKPT